MAGLHRIGSGFVRAGFHNVASGKFADWSEGHKAGEIMAGLAGDFMGSFYSFSDWTGDRDM